MADLTPREKDILIRTILGEARGEGMAGMQAVAQTIRNRSRSGQFPSDPVAVALQPSQYSVWNNGASNAFAPNTPIYNQAAQAIDNVFGGNVPDNTNGALYYHTPAVSPAWSNGVNQYGTTQIGNHIFYNGAPRPSAPTPLMRSSSVNESQAMTSPSGGNTALQSALQQMATRERNRVTPASVEDRVTARNRVPVAPNTAIDDAARRAALTMNQSYAGQERSPTVQQAAKPTPQQINQAARTATLKANQSYVGQERTAPQPQVTQLPRLSVPMAPVGSSNANIANQRAEQLATRAKPVAAIPDRLSPSPAGLPALYGTMTPQQVAQIGVPATPASVTARPLPLAASTPRAAPVPLSRPVGLGAPTMAAPVFAARQPLPIASMPVQQPLTIRVQGSNTIPYPQQRPEAILAQQRINSGRDAVSQSGDTSVGNQREAAEARASGSGGRNRRY